MTRWWLPRPPSAPHHHQRVLATRWTVPPASICPTSGLHLASTTTNESWRLVGGFPGLHLPYTTTNESSRLVGRFPRPPSAFPPPPTSHDDSLGGFLASICPSTTTNGVPSASIRGGDFIVYFCRVFPRLPSGGCKIKNKKIIYIFIHLKALNLRL